MWAVMWAGGRHPTATSLGRVEVGILKSLIVLGSTFVGAYTIYNVLPYLF